MGYKRIKKISLWLLVTFLLLAGCTSDITSDLENPTVAHQTTEPAASLRPIQEMTITEPSQVHHRSIDSAG